MSTASPSLPTSLSIPSYVTTRLRNHTWTGLRLMIIGFALYWVPVLSYVGAVLLLFGVVFLWFGRRAFNEAHRRWVAAGTVLLFVGLVGTLAVAVASYLLLDQITGSAATSASQRLATLQQAVDISVVGNFGVAVVAALGFVAMPYGRADTVSRGILWAGFAISVFIVLELFYNQWSEFSSAIASVSNGTYNGTELNGVQEQIYLAGIAQVVPCILWAWAYLRVRKRLFPGGKKAMRASILSDLRTG